MTPTLLLALSLAQPPLAVDPPHVDAGITCSFHSCDAEARVTITTGGHRPGPRRELGISMHAEVAAPPGSPPMLALDMQFTSLLDAEGSDLLLAAKRGRREPRTPRGSELADAFCGAVMNGGHQQMYLSDSVRGMPSLPSTIARATAEVNVMVATKAHREPVALRATEEAVEVVPGITFLLTKAQPEGERFVISFEVRTVRYREGDAAPPGTEPIFGGLFLYRENDEPLSVLRYGQQLDTRDETITVVRDASFDLDTMGRLTRAEVIVFDDIERRTFHVGITNFPILGPLESAGVASDGP